MSGTIRIFIAGQPWFVPTGISVAAALALTDNPITIIYLELDLEASGLKTGNQEQNGNRIIFVFPSQPPPPDCLPRLQAAGKAWRTSLSADQAFPEGTGLC